MHFQGFVSDRLIDLLSNNERVLPYLDIPLQHAHPEVLKRMHRPADMDWVRKTIAKMRSANPNFAIRSTFIVDFPNETEEEFETHYDFLDEMKFDRVGVFVFLRRRDSERGLRRHGSRRSQTGTARSLDETATGDFKRN